MLEGVDGLVPACQSRFNALLCADALTDTVLREPRDEPAGVESVAGGLAVCDHAVDLSVLASTPRSRPSAFISVQKA